ncbi:hypothetical protein [Leptospira alexanderi]|uniref:Uncharacterized protein n=2 Tax=Leptospira alexanderi TaxID=100053 RepID=V6HXA0_9LEPT|nr:hypothetical protein [Leptospira alexanderi]EQA62575.1 hypothetical protein LEP1GSC062_3458 [Leptospira alexanderi serovar Manhao 3 str. L 60]
MRKLPENAVIPMASERLREKLAHAREAGALVLSLLNTPNAINSRTFDRNGEKRRRLKYRIECSSKNACGTFSQRREAKNLHRKNIRKTE